MGGSDTVRRRRRAFQRERELVKLLWKKGFACMRAPASGSKVKKTVYPDIVAIWKGKVFVFEVKTTEKKRTIYVPKHQVDKLKEFAARAGGRAFIAVKIIGLNMPWKFIPIESLLHTSTGNYKITRDLLEQGLELSDLLREAGIVKDITSYW